MFQPIYRFYKKIGNTDNISEWKSKRLSNEIIKTLEFSIVFCFVIAVISPSCSFYITSRNTYTSILAITIALLFDYLWFMCNLLLLCGDVEHNPGPNQNTAKKIFFLPLEP